MISLGNASSTYLHDFHSIRLRSAFLICQQQQLKLHSSSLPLIEMGRIFIEYIEGRSYSCRCCGAQLAAADGLLSKQFHSKNGPAWLFQACVNVLPGPKEERLMTTGMHVVADIACSKCLNVVGWKYESAAEESQKYKEGKFILERMHVVESDSNGNSSPPRFRTLLAGPSSHPTTRGSDTSESDSY